MSDITAASLTELAAHAFLRRLPAEYIDVLANACTASRVPAGHRFFEEGGPATRFWLIRTGRVALDIHAPGQTNLIIETLGQGELLGLSWLVPPFRWKFGAVAMQETSTFELAGSAMRSAFDDNPSLGYQFLLRAMSSACSRLQATRIRMLDLYDASSGSRDAL